jgi:hypothetical protein
MLRRNERTILLDDDEAGYSLNDVVIMTVITDLLLDLLIIISGCVCCQIEEGGASIEYYYLQ